jgi:hypothetical protein
MNEALVAIDALARKLLAQPDLDDHQMEMISRAVLYATRRVEDGAVVTEREAQVALAAFADGFCTGYHKGNGTLCRRTPPA